MGGGARRRNNAVFVAFVLPSPSPPSPPHGTPVLITTGAQNGPDSHQVTRSCLAHRKGIVTCALFTWGVRDSQVSDRPMRSESYLRTPGWEESARR